jgi:hypothetical protein
MRVWCCEQEVKGSVRKSVPCAKVYRAQNCRVAKRKYVLVGNLVHVKSVLVIEAISFVEWQKGTCNGRIKANVFSCMHVRSHFVFRNLKYCSFAFVFGVVAVVILRSSTKSYVTKLLYNIVRCNKIVIIVIPSLQV